MKKRLLVSQSLEDEDPEELLTIEGLHPRYVAALHRAGIQHVSDLASYTPEALSAELREKAGLKTIPSSNHLEDWIRQAGEKMPVPPTQSELTDDQEANPVSLKNSATEKTSEWSQRAGFTIFFDCKPGDKEIPVWQTRVYHDESGKEDKFDGIEPSDWVGWMQNKAELPIDKTTHLSEKSLSPDAADTHPIGIEFHKVDINASTEEPLRDLEVEVCFGMTGNELACLLDKRVSYCVECYITKPENYEAIQVGCVQNCLTSKTSEYKTLLTFQMPIPGRYELRTFILLPAFGITACQVGPIFTIKL
jgi:hypothetical protein